TTCTSTPSATYFAVLAAPLLDSSSGWAWTCISRRSWLTVSPVTRSLPAVRSDRPVRRGRGPPGTMVTDPVRSRHTSPAVRAGAATVSASAPSAPDGGPGDAHHRLHQRYGRPSRRGHRTRLTVVVVAAIVLAAWAVWA